jgi:hypothetical protein
MCWPSVRWTTTLLRDGFCGAAAARHEAQRAAFVAQHPGVPWLVIGVESGWLADLRAHVDTLGPLVVRWIDFHDEGNAIYHAAFLAAFRSELVFEDPGAFAHVPTCSLHTYHGKRVRDYLVLGPRE